MVLQTSDVQGVPTRREAPGREAQGRTQSASSFASVLGRLPRVAKRGEMRVLLDLTDRADGLHAAPDECAMLSIGLTEIVAGRLCTHAMRIRALGSCGVVLEMLDGDAEVVDAIFAASTDEAIALAAACFPDQTLDWQAINS